jgi:hypothetical protein
MKLTQLEKLFEDLALIRGGVFLLRPADAMRFVKTCKERGIAVLGVEGFKVFGEKIQPFQEHSIEFADMTKGSHEATLQFLQERKDTGLWFEVVTGDR